MEKFKVIKLISKKDNKSYIEYVIPIWKVKSRKKIISSNFTTPYWFCYSLFEDIENEPNKIYVSLLKRISNILKKKGKDDYLGEKNDSIYVVSESWLSQFEETEIKTEIIILDKELMQEFSYEDVIGMFANKEKDELWNVMSY